MFTVYVYIALLFSHTIYSHSIIYIIHYVHVILGEDGLLDVARKTFLQCVEDIYALGEAYARYMCMSTIV